MPSNSDDPGQAAALIVNFLSLLLFWVKHLPPRLPRPVVGHDPIYRYFFNTMTQCRYILDQHSACLPATDAVVTVRVTDLQTQEDQVVPQQAQPPPQPNHRPPRVPTPVPGPATRAPEMDQCPAPQPILHKRKSAQPQKRVVFDL